MEQPRHHEEGEQQNETAETPAEPIFEQLSNEQRIQHGIADAIDEERVIDDATARRIAAQLHGGPDSALHALASSGALPDGLERELLEAAQNLPPETDSWVGSLLDYADARGEDHGPRAAWAEATADDTQQAIEAARSAASRERRADRARLERYVALGLDPGDAEALIEYERLSPEQRAAWAGTFGERPDETDTPETGAPGETAGQAQVASSGTATRPSVRPPAGAEQDLPREPEPTLRPTPRIYLADLAAYSHGRLHGIWCDATRDLEELQAEVDALLARSPIAGAEEIAIHDFENFAGYPLGEYENLGFVVRLARGIAEHGQAFAAYADWIGPGDEQLERFADHYEGTYPSREAWAEELAVEVFEWPRQLDTIVEPLRMHVSLNLASLALDLEQERHLADGDDGVYVFNPHA
ncbi:MAG: antirestriction protein ArdA [Pseudonocardia sp.]